MAISVFKIGGSLFSWGEFPDRLRDFLDQFRAESNNIPVLIAGGGAAADLVRQWDRQFSLGDQSAHRLAIAAMQLNQHLLENLLRDSAIVRSGNEVKEAWSQGLVPLWDLSQLATPNLPTSWDVTSDSLAAYVAIQLQGELVLVKSCNGPADLSVEAAVEQELVDLHFPKLALRLPHIRWVNLRSDEWMIRTELQNGQERMIQ